MPKVSIIMGVYNCKDKAKLKKSVESIQNQTYQNLYKWYREKCNLKIYFFFMKKRVYKSIKKARRRTR